MNITESGKKIVNEIWEDIEFDYYEEKENIGSAPDHLIEHLYFLNQALENPQLLLHEALKQYGIKEAEIKVIKAEDAMSEDTFCYISVNAEECKIFRMGNVPSIFSYDKYEGEAALDTEVQ